MGGASTVRSVPAAGSPSGYLPFQMSCGSRLGSRVRATVRIASSSGVPKSSTASAVGRLSRVSRCSIASTGVGIFGPFGLRTTCDLVIVEQIGIADDRVVGVERGDCLGQSVADTHHGGDLHVAPASEATVVVHCHAPLVACGIRLGLGRAGTLL